LNVGGENIAETRQTLTSLPKILFSILFNGRWENRLHSDVMTKERNFLILIQLFFVIYLINYNYQKAKKLMLMDK
jgi:hypothetical protein